MEKLEYVYIVMQDSNGHLDIVSAHKTLTQANDVVYELEKEYGEYGHEFYVEEVLLENGGN